MIARRRSVGALAFVAGVLSAGVLGSGMLGCNRCTELLDCTNAARLSYTVQMVEHLTGAPVPGVRVRFVRQVGMQLLANGFSHDTVEATSDANGFVNITSTAYAVGYLTGDFTVFPPAPRVPYQVLAQVAQTSTVHGEGRYLGQWAVAPFIDFIGEIANSKAGVSVANAQVTFVRTAGLAMTTDTLTATTDVSGRFFLRAPLRADAGSGVVGGDLTVQAATLPNVVHFTNVTLATTYENRSPLLGGTFDVGPLLSSSEQATAARAAVTPQLRARTANARPSSPHGH